MGKYGKWGGRQKPRKYGKYGDLFICVYLFVRPSSPSMEGAERGEKEQGRVKPTSLRTPGHAIIQCPVPQR
eukprot:9472093-Pyramimonas_sp.AAC.1